MGCLVSVAAAFAWTPPSCHFPGFAHNRLAATKADTNTPKQYLACSDCTCFDCRSYSTAKVLCGQPRLWL